MLPNTLWPLLTLLSLLLDPISPCLSGSHWDALSKSKTSNDTAPAIPWIAKYRTGDVTTIGGMPRQGLQYTIGLTTFEP
jgi:hypothetical protein